MADDKQAKTWGMLCHLTALSLFIGIPFGHIIGPLVVWLIKKDEYPFVDEQGKESLNFQLSMTIYAIVSLILCMIVIGFFLAVALVILEFVLVIMASVKASNGESYKYPMTIRFFK
jgi:uncharacterized Tic20 family protein